MMIKPCPRCGSHNVKESFELESGFGKSYALPTCNSCNYELTYLDSETLNIVWNMLSDYMHNKNEECLHIPESEDVKNYVDIQVNMQEQREVQLTESVCADALCWSCDKKAALNKEENLYYCNCGRVWADPEYVKYLAKNSKVKGGAIQPPEELKPVNEECLLKPIYAKFNKEDDWERVIFTGTSLMGDTDPDNYDAYTGLIKLNKRTTDDYGYYFEYFKYAKRCTDVIYGDEDE